MSSGSNTTPAAIRLSASISAMMSTSSLNLAAARGADTIEGEALPARRNDSMSSCSRPRPQRSPASLRSGHPDRVGRRHSRLDDDRQSSMSVGDHLRPWLSQSRAAKCVHKRSSARLAAFSSRGAGRLSSSKRASAASMSASSNISQRLSQIAFDRQKVDLPPLGVEAFLRGPMTHRG